MGRTLSSLLDEACNNTPNEHAFHQWTETGWQPLANQAFRSLAEAVAVGLLDLGLEKGDRVAFLMHSDLNFCLLDMACLLASLVDVPIDLTQTLEHIIFVLQHSEAKALIVSNVDLLTQIAPYLGKTPHLQTVIVAEAPSGWLPAQLTCVMSSVGTTTDDRALASGSAIPESACLEIPLVSHSVYADQPLATVPQCIQVLVLETVKQQGQANVSVDRLQQLRAALKPHDLATIIYIPDERGQIQGVMLSHENLSANAIASFSGIENLKRGEQEVVLSFLPLNHVLARVMLYGHIHYGHCIYFSNPKRVFKHLKDVRPTVLVTVPLFLEKIYDKILERSYRSPQIIVKEQTYSEGIINDRTTSLLFPLLVSLKAYLRLTLSLLQLVPVRCNQLLLQGALKLAQRYELGQAPTGLYALLLKVADRFVLSQWRATFGDRLKYLICGGAFLSAEIVNAFAAAGMMIFQGYGLTQTSAVVCCNRGQWNRAGTVGVPIAGVEVAIANDSEILVRSPYVMQGYYKNSAMTQEAIDTEGWFHTGDLGTFTDEGMLKLTGLKKALFKLSTGKYIVPQPIEERLKRSSLVAHAVVVGSEQKFCAVLLVPNLEALHVQALENGIDGSLETLLQHPAILALYRAVVDAANCHLPYWATVKRFRLINATVSVENGLLTSNGNIDRAHAIAMFVTDIAALYQDDLERRVNERDTAAVAIVSVSTSDCPAFAQSLNPRLTT
ncbi:AMP-binding protein [Phormidium sp. FACHB-592]|uniref:AMP-binding protein n=1 Tax=Stenomitos frigidus AS-A4 TaxID=2933935 RepID=A0ABV0KLT9_9CYAN|nr:AMP-binding protein [Phormidium sp. FACHB-592]MBD2075136.1 AMP-binding protein [Phormidium sp. FACHB-592]